MKREADWAAEPYERFAEGKNILILVETDRNFLNVKPTA